MDASKRSNGSFETALLIDGHTVKGQGSGEAIVNPASGKKLGSVPSASKAQVEHAVKAAQRAFESWSVTTPQQRSLLLLRLRRALGIGARKSAGLGSLIQAKPKPRAAADRSPASTA